MKRWAKKNLPLLFLVLFTGCSPATPSEFNKESERIQKELLLQFREVETLEDLIHRGPKIRALSFDLVELMKNADTYYRKTHDDIIVYEMPISDALKAEMKRIYELDGGREVVEKYQREALFLLDEYVQSKP